MLSTQHQCVRNGSTPSNQYQVDMILGTYVKCLSLDPQAKTVTTLHLHTNSSKNDLPNLDICIYTIQQYNSSISNLPSSYV